MSSEVKWRFEEIEGIRGVASGDMAKNLKNETQDVDGGLFENDHLSTVVRWFSREFIQNSIDATIEGVVPLIKFRFVSLTGAEKLEFVKSLGLGALLKRRKDFIKNHYLNDSSNCLEHLDDPKTPLRLLFAEEFGCTGLFSENKMNIALVAQNISVKSSTAGGGYGRGKSVNAAASKTRINVVYTRPQKDHPDRDEAEQRLLGIAYWPDHGGQKYPGMGYFENPNAAGSDGTANPFVDESASQVADELGFAKRKEEEYGTSFLILDPEFDAHELVKAITRYWWPALQDEKIRFKVIDEDGEEIEVRPENDPVLREFIQLYDCLQERKSDEAVKIANSQECTRLDNKVGGRMALKEMPQYESEPYPHSSVAMMRDLGMVVHYRKFGVSSPSIQGVFKANSDEEVQGYLKVSEPMLHYKWLDNPDGESADRKKIISTLVRGIYDSVRKRVQEYSQELGPSDVDERVSFPQLNKLFQDVLSGRNGIGPKSTEADFHIQNPKRYSTPGSAEGTVIGKGVIHIVQAKPDVDWLKVSIRYLLPDDSGTKHDPVSMQRIVSPNHGLKRKNDSKKEDLYLPALGLDKRYKINCETVEYSELFLGQFETEVNEVSQEDIDELFEPGEGEDV